MTSDTPTEADTRATESTGEPATRRKPGRRRATRPTAAPVTPAEGAPTAGAGLADLVLPDRASGATPPSGEAPRSLDDIVLPGGPGDAGPEAEKAEKPARSTRAKSASTAKATTRTTAKSGGATRRSTAKKTAEPAAEPSEETPSDDVAAQAAEAPAKKTRARRSTKAAADADAETTEAPAATSGTTRKKPATTAGRKTATRTAAKRSAKAAATADDASTTTDAATTVGNATDDSAAGAATAPARTSEKAPATSSEKAPAKGGSAASAGARAAGSGSSQSGGRGAGTPRLATTAMLFQAPDLSAPRRSRRAQAPAGPPQPHAAFKTAASEPSETAPATDRTEHEPAAAAASGRDAAPARADEPAATSAPATDAPARSARSGRKRATRGTGAPADQAAGAQPETASGEPAAPRTESAKAPAEPARPAADLSEDDVAAVQEVGVIESELVAEGVALVDLGPEDLLEDDGDEQDIRPRRRRRRGGRGRRGGRREDETTPEGEGEDEPDAGEQPADEPERPDGTTSDEGESAEEGEQSSGRRRRRRRRGTRADRAERAEATRGRDRDEVTALKGSTRLEAKKQRRREGRDAGRRRQIITEAEFLARRESVNRSMVVREEDGRTQIAVLEDDVLTEHYVSQQSQASMVGNVYLGRVQNVLPSMEAAFVDVGKGRNAVLYAGEVNWDAAGVEGQPRRIEEALKSGDSVLVQVTKDPIGHKGARLTSQVTLAGRYLVFVPGGGMTGISRKLPDTERSRLKKILREVVPDGAGVIVRTAAEGASEAELKADVERLQGQWEAITAKAEKSSTNAPALLQGEPDMAIRVVRDIFNDDFSSLVVQGDSAWEEISTYVSELAPDLRERVSRWTETSDVFAVHRVDEQLAKGMDRKVWLPSGGSLVIDRTEAMTVIDVNTGKFTGAGGTLEETVTRNNLEAAEEIVRQLRLRDIGGIIVIDFIDMVLESNRDLVLRRLVECLGRDRTKHQVAEVTSLGLVQMTRKRVGQGLVEAFSTTCEHCKGRGFIVHDHPNEKGASQPSGDGDGGSKKSRRKRGGKQQAAEPAEAHADVPKLPDDKSEAREAVKATLATIAAAAAHAHEHADEEHPAPSED